MKEGWSEGALGEVATIERRIIEPHAIAPGTLYVGLENVVSGGGLRDVAPVAEGQIASAKFAFDASHVLFGKLRPNLAKSARPDFTGVCSTDILPILPGPAVDRDYLAHFISLPETVALATQRAVGANLPRLSPKQLERFRLPLPPLDEQRRIARILDAVQALRARRCQAIDVSHALWGSLVEASAAQPGASRPVGDVLERIDSGKSPVCADRPVSDGEWGVLKLGAVSFGEYRPEHNKAILPHTDPFSALEVRAGDVLIARKNTLELVGASAYVWDTPPRMLLPDLIFRLVPRTDAGIRPVYLQALLSRPRTRAAIRRLAGGSAGSMPNISKGRLRTVEITVPPLDVQERFERLVEGVVRVRRRWTAQLAQLESLFSALQHRAFTGAL